jgi:hypothetical protein
MLGGLGGEVNVPAHFSLAYSALACFRMGMSGSASFQRARKFGPLPLGAGVSQQHDVGVCVVPTEEKIIALGRKAVILDSF